MALLFALLFGSINSAFQNPSGTWRLNWDLSEDVPYEETGYAAPPELLLPSAEIVLSVTDTAATFYGGDGTKRRYLLSGEKERGLFRGFDVDTRASWDGRALRLELSPRPGLVVVDHYYRNANRLLLSVTVLQDGSRAGPVGRYAYEGTSAH
jgi:hypothetical protein